MVGQRQAVNKINADNAEALCVAATFISFQALSVPTELREYSPPSVWMDLAAGNGTIFRSAWPWLRESKQLLSMVSAEPGFLHLREMCRLEYPETFPDHPESLFPAFLEFRDSVEDLDSE